MDTAPEAAPRRPGTQPPRWGLDPRRLNRPRGSPIVWLGPCTVVELYELWPAGCGGPTGVFRLPSGGQEFPGIRRWATGRGPDLQVGLLHVDRDRVLPGL